MMTVHSRVIAVSIFVAGVVLGGCGAKNADDSLAAAKAHFAKNDLPAAIIELKNTLQAKPDLGEARLLLGKVLLSRNQPVNAQVELRKARELGQPDDVVVPLMARAMLAAAEWQKIISEFAALTLTSPAARADLGASLTTAYAVLGQDAKAAAALNLAAQAQPEHPAVLLVQARSLAAKREFAEALRVVDRLIAISPQDPDAWQFKGDLLLFAMAQQGGAVDAYRTSLKLQPTSARAQGSLIAAHIAGKDLDAAAKQLAAFREEQPGHPQVAYFTARLALVRGDLKAANDAMQPLLKFAATDAAILELAGTIEFQRGALAQAEQHFGQLVQIAPESRTAKTGLARVLLASGQPDRALAVLDGLLSSAVDDAEVLMLAGSANLQTGKPAVAEKLFMQAVKAEPGKQEGRLALAMTRLSRGDSAAAMDEIARIAETDKGPAADLALIGQYMRLRKFDAALQAIDRLEGKLPQDVKAPFLRGLVLVQQGKYADARKSFERALVLQPAHFASMQGLTALDLRDARPDLAEARFEAAHKAQPENAAVIAALAQMRERAGRPYDEVDALLVKAVTVNPTSNFIRRLLVDARMRARRFPAALSAAQDAVAALPNQAELLEPLALALRASGDTNQAISTYNKLAGLQPDSPAPWLGLARLHAAAKNEGQVADALTRAVAKVQGRPDAARAVASLQLELGRFDDALALARRLQAPPPGAALGWEIEGDVLLARADPTAAAAAYERAQRVQPTPGVTTKLHLALLRSGNVARAEAFATNWSRENPRDIGFVRYLAGLALQRQDFAAAEPLLKKAVEMDPSDAATLNNLAWAMGRLNRPDALAYAEKAVRLHGNHPAYLDTLAVLLAQQKQFDRAVAVQRKAVELAQDNPFLRLGLATMLLEQGDKEAARREIDRLSALGESFPNQKDVQALKARL